MNCLTVPGVHPGSPSRPRGQIQVRAGTGAGRRSEPLGPRQGRYRGCPGCAGRGPGAARVVLPPSRALAR